jgi:transcription elongation factor Elf1
MPEPTKQRLSDPGDVLSSWVECPACGSDSVTIVLARWNGATSAGLECEGCGNATFAGERE